MSRCTTLWQGYSASTYLQPGGRTSSARGFVQRNWSSGWSNSMKEIGGGKKIEEACFHVLSTQEMSLEECTLCSPSEGKKIYVKVKEGWNWSDKPFHFEVAVFPILICHWRAHCTELVFKKLYPEFDETRIFYEGFLGELLVSIFMQHALFLVAQCRSSLFVAHSIIITMAICNRIHIKITGPAWFLIRGCVMSQFVITCSRNIPRFMSL